MAPFFAQPANAQLLDQKSLSAGMAITMAETALETCKASGYRVSISVVGRTSEAILQVRGDNAPPHTVENSQRKAYTARTFRIPSGDWATNLAKDPNRGAQFLTGVIAARGALPIKVGDDRRNRRVRRARRGKGRSLRPGRDR